MMRRFLHVVIAVVLATIAVRLCYPWMPGASVPFIDWLTLESSWLMIWPVGGGVFLLCLLWCQRRDRA